MTRDFHRPGRSAVYGASAMIATSHPKASLVGIEILRRGGSAVDAAIAATALLGVIEPGMTGIGGDCFAIVAKPGAEPVTINGSGRSPAGATLDFAAEHGVVEIADNAPLAVTSGRRRRLVPAARRLRPARSRRRARARRPARQGGLPGRAARRLRLGSQRRAPAPPAGDRGRVLARRPGAARGRRPPPAGSLGATLEKIGRDGRAAFYDGAVADDIVATLKALGGPHTHDDLAAQTSDYAPPIAAAFAGHDILECPPNGQGAAALLLLRALEGWPALEAANDAGERAHLFALATRGAYFLRDRGLTDPAAMPTTIEDFLSERSVAFVRDYAGAPASAPAKPAAVAPWKTDTTCLSVIDRDGLAVSFINSLFNAFGSTILAAKSGVMLHCRGTSFRIDPKHPNRLAPRKRPMHTIIPGMVAKGGARRDAVRRHGRPVRVAGHADFPARSCATASTSRPRSTRRGCSRTAWRPVENGVDDAVGAIEPAATRPSVR